MSFFSFIISLAILLSFEARGQNSFEQSWKISQKTLEDNIISLPSGPYLRAGGTNFGSLWTRDFAWSVRGLMAIGRDDVAKNHLDALLKSMGHGALLPRLLDSIPSWQRVLFGLATNSDVSPLRDPLASEYRGEHSTVAIDSNLLVLMAGLHYVEKMQTTQAKQWWQENLLKWKQLYFYYDSKKAGNFITQQEYGDWQDSVKRSGITFLTNFLYWHVSDKIMEHLGSELARVHFSITQEKQDRLLADLWSNFWLKDQGLFRSHISLYDLVSLDGNLLAIKNKNFGKRSEELGLYHPENNRLLSLRAALYMNLKNSVLWHGPALPGQASYPDYPTNWKSLLTRFVGLTHYHDRMVWTWLIGLSLEVASSMDDHDEAQRIIDVLSVKLTRDQTVTEIYAPEADLPPFQSLLYRSEQPFSWGAAVILQGLEQFERSFE